MEDNEHELRKLWGDNKPHVDSKTSLSTVLRQASEMTAVKDVASLFIGWLWVLLMGVGASLYSAKRRYAIHNQPDLKSDRSS